MKQVEALRRIVEFMQAHPNLPAGEFRMVPDEDAWRVGFLLPDARVLNDTRDVDEWAEAVGAEVKYGKPVRDGKFDIRHVSAGREITPGLYLGVLQRGTFVQIREMRYAA